MAQFKVDQNKCTGCGLCAGECGLKAVVTVEDGKASYSEDDSACIACLHCFKICPNGAISYTGGEAAVYDGDAALSAVITRYSCRHYKDEAVDRSLLTAIINEANTAPRFDIAFKERMFFVVDDAEKLAGLREVVLMQIAKVRRIFCVFEKIPFIPRGKRAEYGMIVNLFSRILKKNRSEEALFHGAPALVMVAGKRGKTTGKDNNLYAMSQLLTAAEEKGLGTCINGFVSFFGKPVQKFLGIPGDYTIDAAAVVGHSSVSMARHLVRSDSAIIWN